MIPPTIASVLEGFELAGRGDDEDVALLIAEDTEELCVKFWVTLNKGQSYF